MIKIRRNVFETNSSSTHSICISNEKFDEELPSLVNFRLGEFGWEERKYDQIEDKASYLYTAICELGKYSTKFPKQQYLDFIVKVFDKNNIRYDFQDPETSDFYYVDHVSELDDFIKSVCHSEKRLIKYLFSDKSFIMTGNDNDDSDVDICVPYRHEEYYKGN